MNAHLRTRTLGAPRTQLYEKTYGESLSKALKGKCGDRLHYALTALLVDKTEFIAMRLHDASKGWFTNK